jgi:hypothetical protein
VFCETLGNGYALRPDVERDYTEPLYMHGHLPRLVSGELFVADVDGRMVSAPTDGAALDGRHNAAPTGDIGGRMVSTPTDGAALGGRMVSTPTGESTIVGADIIRPQTDATAK